MQKSTYLCVVLFILGLLYSTGLTQALTESLFVDLIFSLDDQQTLRKS